MARLLLIRHGESEWNAASRWQGWADPPLSAQGEAEARAAAARLAHLGLRALVSSDLRRARSTAEILGRALGFSGVTVEPDLRERDVGDWTGLTAVEIDERWPGAREAWRDGRMTEPPNGEPTAAFVGRITAALGRVSATVPGTVLVVTHGGVIRVLARHLGVEPRPVPNLGGRWFEWTDGTPRAGADVDLVGGQAQGEARIL